MPPAFAMPMLRTAKLMALRAQTQWLVRTSKPSQASPSFIVGCGRSGTTILGTCFMTHPQVTYLREPYHLWRCIDARTDVTGLHGSIEGTRYFLDAKDRTERAQRRFNRLIAGAARPGTRVIEKMPHNVARIGWLESLTHESRYVHIARNGLSVSRSIGRITANPTYRMAFKGNYAQWWGTNLHRWTALREEAIARGYFSDEVDLLACDTQKGAYEWIVSVSEADRHRGVLGDRLLEITYSQLTADTPGTLTRLCAHFGIEAPSAWLAQADGAVGTERVNEGDELRLPAGMAARFNEIQDRFAFEGRAGVLA